VRFTSLPTLLKKCIRCKTYTLKQDKCPRCGGPLITPHPPKFSPDDRYIKYRIMAKKAAGLLKD